jgi:hypothetical protein
MRHLKSLKISAIIGCLALLCAEAVFAEQGKNQDKSGNTLWREPAENAFTLTVPPGWKVAGSILRQTPALAHPSIEAMSDDRSMMFFSNDGIRNFLFQTPNALSRRLGVRQTNGMPYASPQRPEQVLAQYIKSFPPKVCSEIKIESDKRVTRIAGVPVPVRHLVEVDPQRPHVVGGIPARFFLAEAYFSCVREQKPTHGYAMAVVGVMQTGSVGMWAIDTLFGYLAPVGREKEAAAAALTIADSYREDPRWTAQQKQITSNTVRAGEQASQNAMALSRTITKNSNDESNMIMDSYEKRSHMEDENSRKWSNVILGNTDVKNPETGETSKVQNTSTYYQQHRDGTITGSETYRPATLDETPLENMQ